MKTVPLYRVSACHDDGDSKYFAVAHFDRLPTEAELLENLLVCFEHNESVRPGFTERIGLVYSRGVPDPTKAAMDHAGASFIYPDGWIKVESVTLTRLGPAGGDHP